MLLPSLFNDRDWDHLMSESFDPFESWWTNRANNLMRTDIKSVDEGYELTMDLPGFAKDDISVSLSDGYLTVKADHEDKDETKDEKDDYIRRERYYGHLERSFYVGDQVDEDHIKAQFKDGSLILDLPKYEEKALETAKAIPIEG